MQINDNIELHHKIAAVGNGFTLPASAHDRSQRYDNKEKVSCQHELHMSNVNTMLSV